MSSEAPFNFQMERIDSFMMQSVEDDDQKNMENTILRRSRPLSHFFQKSIFDRF
jgi:hypothetical protein